MMFRALLIPPHRVREFLYLQLREVRSGKWCAAARLPRAGRFHAPELPQGISAPLADVKLPGRLKIELKTRDQSWEDRTGAGIFFSLCTLLQRGQKAVVWLS